MEFSRSHSHGCYFYTSFFFFCSASNLTSDKNRINEMSLSDAQVGTKCCRYLAGAHVGSFAETCTYITEAELQLQLCGETTAYI